MQNITPLEFEIIEACFFEGTTPQDLFVAVNAPREEINSAVTRMMLGGLIEQPNGDPLRVTGAGFEAHDKHGVAL